MIRRHAVLSLLFRRRLVTEEDHVKRRGGQQLLKELIELYPGNLTYGDTRTGFNCVLERFSRMLQEPDSRPLAERFIAHVEDVLNRLNKEFPEAYKNTKNTVNLHLNQMKEKLR